MDDLEQKLFSGARGEALRALAASEEARRLGGALDAEAEAAVRSGDSGRMRALLARLLDTEEGRTLAAKLAGLGGGK